MEETKTLTFQARVKPNARQPGLALDDGILRVSVKAKPVEGRANDAAIKLIADAFRLPRRSVELVRGAHNRNKFFRISGIESPPKEFEALLKAEK